MPVNILYCEGVSGSWDIQLLQMLLVNTCNVYPAGGKDNFSAGIQMAREAIPALSDSIYGLRDRDFDDEKPVPNGQLLEWEITAQDSKVKLGWRWERKEIENYLIDPEVVQRSLGHPYSHFAPPPRDQYEKELNRVADEIAIYTAARSALSLSRKPNRLKNSFYPHSTEIDCIQHIHEILDSYHAGLPQKQGVIDQFQVLLPECKTGGNRRTNFLTFFSGKDLLIGMNNFLTHSGFKNWEYFVKAILEGMKKAQDPVWSWLSEWENLREKILT